MHPLYQAGEGGSTLTVPLSAKSLRVDTIDFDEAKRLNRLWHSRLPRIGDPEEVMRVGPHFAAVNASGVAYAVAIWSHPVARKLPQKTWLELRRLAVAPDASHCAASWMLGAMAKAIRRSCPDIIRLVSYQDTEVHTGTIYRASGWTPVAQDKPSNSDWNNGSRIRPTTQSTARKQRWEKSLIGGRQPITPKESRPSLR